MDVPRWTEEVDDLVDAGEVDGAISLLESVVSKLSTDASPSGPDLRLATALGDLAGLHASRGNTLRADELRTRAIVLRSRAAAPGALGDHELAEKSSSQEGTTAALKDSEASASLDENNEDEDEDWEAIADRGAHDDTLVRSLGRVMEWETGLPGSDELTPLSQPLVPPELAAAFRIPPEPGRTLLDVHRASAATVSRLRRASSSSSSSSFPTFQDSAAAAAAAKESNTNNTANSSKRPRLVWTPQLHKRFVDVVAHLGIKNAVPKTIMQLMNVEGLTRENVASHLQKYRLYVKRMQGLSNEGPSASDHIFASTPVPQALVHEVPAPPPPYAAMYHPMAMGGGVMVPMNHHHHHQNSNGYGGHVSSSSYQYPHHANK